MRIAQVSPLYESVPPKKYGGTERTVSYLTESLVDSGHEVTLFASGDSVTRARLLSPCQRSLRTDPHRIDQLTYHLIMLEDVYRRLSEFDLVHFHVDYLHYPRSREKRFAHVTTLHGRLDLRDLIPLYREFRQMPVVSISDSQRRPIQWLNWKRTIYHGLPETLYTFHPRQGSYLAFLGRISPEKGLERAIEIAHKLGMPLKVAAKLDTVDVSYFKEVIKPLLSEASDIELIGEIGDHEKNDFLGGALALLFPINWPEPFGLVMIEAMACGTPVLTFDNGSTREIIEDGVNGFIVDSIAEAVKALDQIANISRRRCRELFEQRFTARRMAQEYERLYEELRQDQFVDQQAAAQTTLKRQLTSF